MNPYHYRATPSFWKAYRRLTVEEQDAAKRAFRIFLGNPFDARLRTHRIHGLSARAGRTIYSVTVAEDLRAVFFIRGNEVVSFDIGTHDVYRR